MLEWDEGGTFWMPKMFLLDPRCQNFARLLRCAEPSDVSDEMEKTWRSHRTSSLMKFWKAIKRAAKNNFLPKPAFMRIENQQ